MAERRPLVYVNGGASELPIGDTIVGGGGGVGESFSASFAFVGDGADDTFDLAAAIDGLTTDDIGYVFVDVAGVPQSFGTHFTISGTNLVFDDPPADGAAIFGVVLGPVEFVVFTPPVKLAGINAQTSNYTLSLTDSGKAVTMNSGSANTLTVPPQSSVAWQTGALVQVMQRGAGQTELVEGSGVTLIAGPNDTLFLEGEGAWATLIRLAEDVWAVTGRLEAA